MNDPSVLTNESTKEASVMKNFEPSFSSVYADAGVLCPALKVNVHSGDTVLVKDGCGRVRVGRVLDIVSHDKVIVNRCTMIDYGHFKQSPLFDESLRANVELYQGGANDEVSSSRISDVAYVFSQEYITDNNVDLSGIKNAYIIRFRVTNDKRLRISHMAISSHSHHCIHCTRSDVAYNASFGTVLRSCAEALHRL
jgi:ribosomal protein L24